MPAKRNPAPRAGGNRVSGLVEAAKLNGPDHTTAEASRQERPFFPAASIYDGCRHLGDVFEVSPGRFEAITADGELISTYPNSRAATDAILAVARQRGQP